MKRFSIVENGYDVDEVNRFIDIVIGRLEKLNAENTAYVAKIEKLNEKLQNVKPAGDEGRLEKAILAVQETADRMREMSREEARLIVEEAKNNANSIIHEALIKAEKNTSCKEDKISLAHTQQFILAQKMHISFIAIRIKLQHM